MTVEPLAPKGVPSWQAMSLRVSLFPSSPIDATEKLWTAMMGAPPETQERRARAISTKFTGAMEGATVVLASNPLRIDVTVQPSPPPPETIPSIVAGDATKLKDLVAERVPALLSCLPSLTRIAFAGILLHQVNSPEDVLKLLKGMLKSVAVDERMRDLLFRVNWATTMQNGLIINRVTTWSGVTVKISAATPPDAPDALLAVNHYVRFEFDNNTAPEPTVTLDAKAATEAFSRCVQLATENMVHGEIISA